MQQNIQFNYSASLFGFTVRFHCSASLFGFTVRFHCSASLFGFIVQLHCAASPPTPPQSHKNSNIRNKGNINNSPAAHL